jgi:hypothetical protein
MTIYRKNVIGFWTLTGVLIVIAFLLEKNYSKVLYDLVIAGAGFAAAIASTVTIVDVIQKRREKEEWSFVRRMALKQVRWDLRVAAAALARCFVDVSGDLITYLMQIPETEAETAKRFSQFVAALDRRPKPLPALRNQDGDTLFSTLPDYAPAINDICNIQFQRLIQSQCERSIIDALIAFDDTWRTLEHSLTSWSHIDREQKLDLDIGWANFVSLLMGKMAILYDRAVTASAAQ